MLNRLDNHININNNLLDQIKIEYSAMFQAVKRAIKQLASKYNLSEVDDNEIGFLTLYFASELEKHKKHIDTLIMCTTGIGTSELLKSKIIANFSNLNIVDVISTASLDEALRRYPQIQLVISTVRPLHAVSVPVVVVSAMLNMEDRKSLMRRSNICNEIKDYETCALGFGGNDEKALFDQVATLLQENDVIESPRQAIKLWQQREKMGSTMIDQLLAAPHAQARSIKRNTVVLVHTCKPIQQWDEHDDAQNFIFVVFNKIFLN